MNRTNRRSSILIDGDEDNKTNQHEVTLEDFLRFIHENLNGFMENSD